MLHEASLHEASQSNPVGASTSLTTTQAAAPLPVEARPRGLGGRRFLLSLAIIGASISLALGITMPSIKLTKFYFFSTEYS